MFNNCRKYIDTFGEVYSNHKDNYLKMLEKYENLYEPLDRNLKATSIYKDFLATLPFEIGFLDKILLPKGLQEKYDWEILLRLLIGGNRSFYCFYVNQDKYDILIDIESYFEEGNGILCKLPEQRLQKLIFTSFMNLIYDFVEKAQNTESNTIISKGFEIYKHLITMHQKELKESKVASFVSIFSFRRACSNLFTSEFIHLYEEKTHSVLDCNDIKNNVIWTHYLKYFELPEELYEYLWTSGIGLNIFYLPYFTALAFPRKEKIIKICLQEDIGCLDVLVKNFRISKKDSDMRWIDLTEISFQIKTSDFVYFNDLYNDLLMEHFQFFIENCSFKERTKKLYFENDFVNQQKKKFFMMCENFKHILILNENIDHVLHFKQMLAREPFYREEEVSLLKLYENIPDWFISQLECPSFLKEDFILDNFLRNLFTSFCFDYEWKIIENKIRLRIIVRDLIQTNKKNTFTTLLTLNNEKKSIYLNHIKSIEEAELLNTVFVEDRDSFIKKFIDIVIEENIEENKAFINFKRHYP